MLKVRGPQEPSVGAAAISRRPQKPFDLPCLLSVTDRRLLPDVGGLYFWPPFLAAAQNDAENKKSPLFSSSSLSLFFCDINPSSYQ